MKFSATIFFIALILMSSLAQINDPFIKLYSGKGFDVKFIFYSEGTGKQDNGVVILLVNRNQYKIGYSFDLIFRTIEKDKSINITGILNAGERKTGSEDDLYFLPFDDKSSIGEVGIRKVRVVKLK